MEWYFLFKKTSPSKLKNEDPTLLETTTKDDEKKGLK